MDKRSKYLCGFVVALLVVGLVAWTGFRRDRAAEVAENEAQEREARASHTGPVTYNPAHCKRDADGMVYFALGQVVFRVPHTEPLGFTSVPPENLPELPRRPDPTEPEGCPDNPVAASNARFAYRYQALKTDKRDPRLSMTPDQLSLIAIDRAHLDPQWGRREAFYRAQMKYGPCEEAAAGIVACVLQNKGPKSRWPVYYKVKSTFYPTPTGHPIFVECGAGVVAPTCYVAYDLSDELRVAYRFKTQNIPIDKFVDYDQGLRAGIAAAQVKDYPWPE